MSSPAAAFPDGAPWGSADPASPNNCASCHFDGEIQVDSRAISLTFGGRQLYGEEKQLIEPGQTIRLHLNFKPTQYNSAGFLVVASSGIFVSPTSDMEVNDQQIRSLKPKAVPVYTDKNAVLREKIISWEFDWTAPAKPDRDFVFSIVVNENNEDASSFGDVIHFKTVMRTMPGDFSFVPPN